MRFWSWFRSSAMWRHVKRSRIPRMNFSTTDEKGAKPATASETRPVTLCNFLTHRWHHRESNRRPSDLKRNASTNRATAYPMARDSGPNVLDAEWDPGPVWAGAENFIPTRIRSPDHLACSRSLYRLSYGGPPHKINTVKDMGFRFLKSNIFARGRGYKHNLCKPLDVSVNGTNMWQTLTHPGQIKINLHYP
jgi:hypothetical protein